MSKYTEQMDSVVAAWKPFIDGIDDWTALVEGLEPKATGCGPVYEPANPIPGRGNESFAIADMRNVRVAEPHYHPNGETEIYMVLSGLGKIVVGGKQSEIEKGSVVITPPDTTHFTVPVRDLVLAVINTPSFDPANYKPITESDEQVGFDKVQFKTLVKEAYTQAGLAVESGRDEPGTLYEPHRHEKTYLYTISGAIDIKLDGGETQTLQPHQEFIVNGDQLHEAVVGADGWEYVAAFDAEEAKGYAHE